MIDLKIPCQTVPPRSWIARGECVAAGASILIHAAAWGAAVAAVYLWGDQLLETTQFSGRQRAVHLQAHWAPDSPPPAVEEESAVQVVIEPTAARIEQHHFRQVAAAEVVIALSETGEPAVTEPTEPNESPTAERTEAAREQPQVDQEPPRPLPKAKSSSALSIAQAAAVPQVLGTEATIPPRFFNNRPPLYPEVARARGWQGTVLLDLKIDQEGQVVSVTLRQSSGFAILDAEAVAAVKQWRAEPAKRGGRAVATEEILPVRFVLR